ncbi:ADP-ribosylglycohydrolase [Caulifigura coniformis]|uniref:ADP-ribosylglycohydrolase n=1 Tax=Caulifigura coniformis TaxID=2527983 RepID=A0A517SD01_9PLAN|nr:ADP-ribosylglycohydrolase family protein [Caulifigura coniformis]QDT53985.1 ADP-ribosylglycohydrolase [Caulifigura coniformis]
MNEDAVIGCLLGAAVGDALGLPYEGLSKQRAARLLGSPDRFRMLGRRGLVSDDTEHLCLVSQSLIQSGGDVDRFERELARRLRRWFLMLPAGIGLATLKACLKLCLGIPPSRSGVRSAGNGPSMRASIIGSCVESKEHCLELVRRSSRMTHTDPRAIDGAKAVAMAARLSSKRLIPSGQLSMRFLAEAIPCLEQDCADIMRRAAESVVRGESTEAFARSLGSTKKVTGFVLTSVPVAIHAWLTSPDDYMNAVTSVIVLGGDTDTMAAITGGIVGCRVGENGLPSDLLRDLRDPPRSIAWMRSLGSQLARQHGSEKPVELQLAPLFCRNALFAVVVLAHGLRRLAPPW